MLSNFKKLGVAAAVAAALGASGAAQAVTLGEPGGALLIPHVIFDSEIRANTLIGVTVGDQVPVDQFPTISDTGSACANGGSARVLHWYFFNTESTHLADGTVTVTCDDFSRFDWGFVITNPDRPFPSLDGVPGYLVISSNETRSDAPADFVANYTLYGSAYLIQGNWQSEAYIPVLPLRDTSSADPSDEVRYQGGIPREVNPLLAGMALAYDETVAARFSMRYFLDPALQGRTSLVLWFPDNSDLRDDLTIDVYDADEVAVSNIIDLPDELNVVAASSIDGTINNPADHAIPDLAFGQPAINSGFIVFNIADSAEPATAPVSRAGIAFSLIGIGTEANSVQVQTDLAHERGIVNAQ